MSQTIHLVGIIHLPPTGAVPTPQLAPSHSRLGIKRCTNSTIPARLDRLEQQLVAETQSLLAKLQAASS